MTTSAEPNAVPVEPRGGTGAAPDGTARYSVPEAARILGISERAVRKRIDAGTLFAIRDGRAWTVYLESPERGTSSAPSAVPAEPITDPAPEHAVPSGTSTAVDITPLVALVDNLTRRNAELTEAAAIWQFRAMHAEEQLKQLTPGPLDSDASRHDAPQSDPTARSATEPTPVGNSIRNDAKRVGDDVSNINVTEHRPSVFASLWDRLRGRG